jgi:hypothetical protein
VRLRIILLALATSSLVLVSFLVPLALVLRTFAADRAVSTATAQAQSLALLVPTLSQHSLGLEVSQMNAENGDPITIILPGGTELGPPAAPSDTIRLTQQGHSFSTGAPGGIEILVAVQGLNGGTAVIRTFVPDAVLRHGVTRTWLLLGGVALFLLLLSIAVADQLARSLVRPLKAVTLGLDPQPDHRAPAAGTGGSGLSCLAPEETGRAEPGSPLQPGSRPGSWS